MASTIKQRLRRFNGTDYDTIHLETQESQIVADYSKYLQTRPGLQMPPPWGSSTPSGSWHDLNECVESGLYRWSGSYQPANIPSLANEHSGVCLVLAYDTEAVTQIAYIRFNPGGYYNTIVAERTCYNSFWRPWHYRNPPMVDGVEYPTTEIFQNQVVYTYSKKVGSAARDSYMTQVYHGISDIRYVISATGYMVGTDICQSIPSSWYTDISAGTVVPFMNRTYIGVKYPKTSTDPIEDYSLTVIAKYIKNSWE